MLTSLIEEYRFNKNTLSKYLEITEETVDWVAVSYTHLDVYKRQGRNDSEDWKCRDDVLSVPIQKGEYRTHDPVLCPA